MSKRYIDGVGWTDATNTPRGRTMTEIALTYQDCEQAWAQLAAQAPGPMSASALKEWALRRLGHDGKSTFETAVAEGQAIALTAQELDTAYAEVALAASNWGQADVATEVARIAAANPGVRLDFGRIAADMSPVTYADAPAEPVRAAAVPLTTEQEAEVARLSGVPLHGKVPEYGSNLLSREDHASSLQLSKADHTTECENTQCDGVSCGKKHTRNVDAEVARLLKVHSSQTHPRGGESPESGNKVHAGRR